MPSARPLERKLCSFVIAISTLGTGCAATFDISSPAGAARASNRFGFELYEQVKAGQNNVVCSPAGAAIALSMASAGARGKTLEQMTNVLHVDATQAAASHASFGSLLATLNRRNGREGVALEVADRVWGDEGVDFESDFLSVQRTDYGAALETVDFGHEPEQARNEINEWGAARTHGRITELLPQGSVHAGTRVVLANAVYFKGAWAEPFSLGATSEQPFSSPVGDVPVKMMATTRMLKHADVSGASVVELPYKGGLSMVVMLPADPAGLDAMETRLVGSYDDWVRALRFKRVDLWLPRFSDTSKLSLGHALEAMGMGTAFGQHADFTGMAERKPGDPPLVIDQALQQAFIEVDEVGTEAAAATAMAITMDIMSARPEPEHVVFRADHPFAYVIRDVETGVVLFAGRVVEPPKDQDAE